MVSAAGRYQSSVSLRGVGFPARLVVRQPFTNSVVSSITTSSITTGYATAGYYINNIWDPIVGASKPMPYYTAQIAALGYRRFCVYGVKFRIVFSIPAASSLTSPFYAGYVLLPSTAGASFPFSTYEEIIAAAGAYSGVRVRMFGGPQAKGYCVMTGYLDIAKFQGITRRQLLTEDNYAGTVTGGLLSGASPVKLIKLFPFICLNSSGGDGTANPQPVVFTTSLRCYTVYSSRIPTIVPPSATEEDHDPLNDAYDDGQEDAG